jgi:hypothetical protein
MSVLPEMTDAELRSATDQCYLDLIQAATLAPQGERHQQCFAAMYLMCEEMTARGITVEPTGVMQ